MQCKVNILLWFADIYLFSFTFFAVHQNPLIEDEAVEDSDLYTEEDFENF